jgi:WD40 repeat protein
LFAHIGTRIARLKCLGAQSERAICLGNGRSTLCSAMSADGLLLALGDADGKVRVWNLSGFANRWLDTPIVSR